MKSETDLILKKMTYSIAELAEMLGVSAGHLRNENNRGKLQFIRSGRRILIKDSEVRRYLDQQISEVTAA